MKYFVEKIIVKALVIPITNKKEQKVMQKC